MFCQLNSNPVIRIITKPYQYICHSEFRRKDDKDDKGDLQRIICAASLPSNDNDPKLVGCKFCEISKAQARWIVGVINKSINEYRLLDIGANVFSQIKILNQNMYWGDPETYDIQLVSTDVYDDYNNFDYKYQVIPISKTPLSPEDVAIKSNIDLDFIKAKCDPQCASITNELYDTKKYEKVYV